MFLNILQNSQENSCARVSFACNFNKKEALAQVASCEFCKIGLTSNTKDKSVQKFPKNYMKVYVCVYIIQTSCNRKNVSTTSPAVDL